jgi:amino acid transporter
MPQHDEPLSSARTLFLLMLYALDLALGVFGIVALFHIIDEYNVVLLVLNLITFAAGVLLYFILKPQSDTEKKTLRWSLEKRFLRLSMIAALLLSVLRAVWQALVASENAENISPVNEQEFYFTYLALAILRTAFFALITERIAELLWY